MQTQATTYYTNNATYCTNNTNTQQPFVFTYGIQTTFAQAIACPPILHAHAAVLRAPSSAAALNKAHRYSKRIAHSAAFNCVLWAGSYVVATWRVYPKGQRSTYINGKIAYVTN